MKKIQVSWEGKRYVPGSEDDGDGRYVTKIEENKGKQRKTRVKANEKAIP